MDILDCPETNMDSALLDAVQVHKLQRWEEELEQCLGMLEQEMHSLDIIKSIEPNDCGGNDGDDNCRHLVSTYMCQTLY